ncbi:MAG: hypothetical protein FWF50_02380 [Defluviitaleaceae bacterium]|nr:hypothetical protein [Defluviitaleaceae bacterium]
MNKTKNTDYIINKQGGKVYIDSERQTKLDIDKQMKVTVLSVGFTRDRKFPIITIKDGKGVNVYRINKHLIGWAETLVGFAMMGNNVFPCDVEFGRDNTGRYYAELL